MAASVHREIERKFDVEPDIDIPDLSAQADVESVDEPRNATLTATYFDTADLTLARNRITLRRRTGGEDAGWHLKLPVAIDERREIRLPLEADLGTGHVPPELLGPIRVHVRDSELIPVALIQTERAAYFLRAADDSVLAELADDRVTATRLTSASGPVTTWREWELELVEGSSEFLEDACGALLRRSARPAAIGSKLARALGDPPLLTAQQPLRPSSKTTAAELVVDTIARQVANLKTADPAVRADAHDSVHAMRVATRQIRSILEIYLRVFDREATAPILAELRWFAGVLGAARDAEVALDRLRALLTQLPAELIVGSIESRLTSELTATYQQAHAITVSVLDGARYFRLLDTIDAFVDRPPLTDRAHRSARRVLSAALDRAYSQLRRSVGVSQELQEPMDREGASGHRDVGYHNLDYDQALHRVRKRAKRLRYAAEAAAPVSGEQAARVAQAAKQLQTILGEHQDSVTLRPILRAAAVRAHQGGEDTFTYGLLYQLEVSLGAQAAERHLAAIDAVRSAYQRL